MTGHTKAYLAVRQTTGTLAMGFSVLKTREEAINFLDPNPTKPSKDSSPYTEDAATQADTSLEKSVTDEGLEDQVIALMLRYVNLVFSFYPLIAIGTTLKAPITAASIDTSLVTPARSMFPSVHKSDIGEVFELNAAAIAMVNKKVASFWSLERGLSALPNASFLSIVASFDSIFAEIIYFFLKLYPQRFSNQSTEIAVSRVIELGSVDALIDSIIKDELFELMRGSHDEQTDFVKDKLDVDIKTDWPRYGDFIELFERRNLIAHGEKLYTARYASKLTVYKKITNAGIVGSEIQITSKYLRQSSDILLEYGVLLIFSLWRKHLKSSEESSFDWVNIISTKAISENRNLASTRILSYIIKIKSSRFKDQSRKMATVNLANGLFRLNKKDEAEKVLADTDWSAVSLDYSICIAAIRNDISRVVELMEPAVKSGSMNSDNFREWPAFDALRDNADFLEQYQNLFGEPLTPIDFPKQESLENSPFLADQSEEPTELADGSPA
ncbi:hypothetical protein [Sphingomonas sp. BK036]|uniref:hypothetical protein n=1 Tax=Sphingomonas sp. BK036 TaxID=2512122 RepID=UPI0010292D5A|nr:hypothetical protein [Sphingomonas sp. BK036]